MRSQVLSELGRPDVLVLGGIPDSSAELFEAALAEVRSAHPDLPTVLAGPAVGGDLPRGQEGTRTLERIDESVDAVEALLGAPAARRSIRSAPTPTSGSPTPTSARSWPGIAHPSR